MRKKSQNLNKEQALSKMQKYCAYQDRCHYEVRSKLLALEVYGDELEEIMASLIVDKFLDEERFARSYARGKFNIKFWGRMRIKRELKMRKISDYCIRKAMEEIDDDLYIEKLQMVLQKKNNLLRDEDRFKRIKKLSEHAIRRGFEMDLVWEQINAMDI